MNNTFLELIKKRRSIYALAKQLPISDKQLTDLVGELIKHTPSAFNSQSSRVVILLNNQHDKLWDITHHSLEAIVPPEHFASTKQKLDTFKSGYGTILFFEDQTIISELEKAYPSYKHNFPSWSLQSSGMVQFAIWSALANEGIGASLQHYNELIEDEVKKTFAIDKQWKLISQMPFGKIASEASSKEFKAVNERLLVKY